MVEAGKLEGLKPGKRFCESNETSPLYDSQNSTIFGAQTDFKGNIYLNEKVWELVQVIDEINRIGVYSKSGPFQYT